VCVSTFDLVSADEYGEGGEIGGVTRAFMAAA
jgi:hypothetical protein